MRIITDPEGERALASITRNRVDPVAEAVVYDLPDLLPVQPTR